jgi:hypothetical protein
MPMSGGGSFEAKVTGKVLELRATSPGRTVLELWLNGGKHLSLPVVVEGEAPPAPVQVSRTNVLMGETVEVPVNGEKLLKTLDVESVQVEDDDVAEVRIVGDGRVVVRGLNVGDTRVLIHRGGRVYSHPVYVTGQGE